MQQIEAREVLAFQESDQIGRGVKRALNILLQLSLLGGREPYSSMDCTPITRLILFYLANPFLEKQRAQKPQKGKPRDGGARNDEKLAQKARNGPLHASPACGAAVGLSRRSGSRGGRLLGARREKRGQSARQLSGDRLCGESLNKALRGLMLQPLAVAQLTSRAAVVAEQIIKGVFPGKHAQRVFVAVG